MRYLWFGDCIFAEPVGKDQADSKWEVRHFVIPDSGNIRHEAVHGIVELEVNDDGCDSSDLKMEDTRNEGFEGFNADLPVAALRPDIACNPDLDHVFRSISFFSWPKCRGISRGYHIYKMRYDYGSWRFRYMRIGLFTYLVGYPPVIGCGGLRLYGSGHLVLRVQKVV